MNAFYADVTPAMAMSVIGDVFEAGVAAPVRALLDHGSDTAEQAYDAAKMILSHPEEAVRAFGEGVLADATNVVTAYERAGKALAHGDFAGAFAIWNDAAKSAFNLAALIVGGGPKWMRFARAAGAAAAMVKINLLKAAGAWVWRQARKAAEKADDAAGAAPGHRIMTNKNRTSTARGGPWTPRFEDMARRAGMTLDDAANRVRIPGHRGPHPEAYHREVFDRLSRATEGLSGDAYSGAFRAELDAIRTEAATAGSALNRLLVP